jgi:hypothetical protein
MHEVVDNNNNPYRSMIIDAMRMNQGYAGESPIVDEESNVDVVSFFDVLKDFNEPSQDMCTNYNKLLVVALVLVIKSEHGLSEVGYDRIIEKTRNILLEEN